MNPEEELKRQQQDAKAVQVLRTETMGNVLRSKGFVWMANTHDLMGVVGQAGNIVTVETPGIWNVLDYKAWLGSAEQKAALQKDWVSPWGDRRQELVFIGQDLKHQVIQKILDDCLLTDEEFALGLDGWKATMGDIFLDGGESEEYASKADAMETSED